MHEAMSFRAAAARRQIIASGSSEAGNLKAVSLVVIHGYGIGARAKGLRDDVVEVAGGQQIQRRREVPDRSFAAGGSQLIGQRDHPRYLRRRLRARRGVPRHLFRIRRR